MSRSEVAAKRVTYWKLYWCTTPDHDEDWFVVARSAREARRYHEQEEGYASGDATAKRVCRMPEGYTAHEANWPDHDLIRACGGKILTEDTPRAVEIAGAIYREGTLEALIRTLDDDEFERRNQGRPNGTVRPERN